MKRIAISSLTVAVALGAAWPTHAEDLTHLQQLLSTQACQRCDLTRAGLVYADLEGVDLTGADLSQANLNRANLRNANLQGANLSGAVLVSADLTGADLRGATLTGADLREAVMTDVILEGAELQSTNLLGARGLSEEIATPEQLYLWGMAEAQRGNFRGAINYYNQALSLKPEFSHALLARGIARYRLSDEAGAVTDAKDAEQLYLAEGDAEGHQSSIQFYEGIEAMQEAAAEGRSGGGGNFLNLLGSLTGVLMRVLF
jgi:tetratricopeptide (TPR) repeat protein